MNVFAAPTMSVGAFTAVLKDAGSPVLAERPAAEYYNLIAGYGIDPTFILAVCKLEHAYATNPKAVVVRYGIKNWGDTRTRRKASLTGKSIATDRGNFWSYASWRDSLDDLCYRLADPSYAYAGKRTVEEIVPVMAPPGDMDNDPDAYVRNTLALMRGWKEAVTVAYTQYADRMAILPAGYNRDGRRLSGFHAFVIHETANEQPGAGVQNTLDWLSGKYNSGIRPDASFHFVADANEVAQILPAGPNDAEVGYHIGDGVDQPDDEGLFTTSVEICVNSRAGFPAACRRAAKVVAGVLKAHGKQPIDGDTIRQHGSYWSARNPAVHSGCPQHLKAGDWGVTWKQFVDMVKAEYGGVTAAAIKKGITVTLSDADELKQFGEAIDPAIRGDMLREGEADLRQYGGGQSERVVLYERMITHRLAGKNFVLTLALWDSLRNQNLIHIFPAMPW